MAFQDDMVFVWSDLKAFRQYHGPDPWDIVIIFGVLLTITIFGAIVGIPVILAGVALITRSILN